MQNGLQKGVKEGIEELNEAGLEFYNFALGANDSLHKIFATVKNEEKIL